MQILFDPVVAILLVSGVAALGRITLLSLGGSIPFKNNSMAIEAVIGLGFITILLQVLFGIIGTGKYFSIVGLLLVIGGGVYIAFELVGNQRKGFKIKFQSFEISRQAPILLLWIYILQALLVPETNADALDYHLGYAKLYLDHPFDPHKEWLHGGLSGAGEICIALGLSLGSYSFARIMPVVGLYAIYEILINVQKNGGSYRNDFYSWIIPAVIGAPVFIFLGVSSKPQLLPLAMILVSFYFCALVFFKKVDKTVSARFLLNIALALAYVAVMFKISFAFSFLLILTIVILQSVDSENRLVTLAWVGVYLALLTVCWAIFLEKREIIRFVFTLSNPLDMLGDKNQSFYEMLKLYKDSSFPFPFYLLIPSSIGNVTTVFGIAVLFFVLSMVQIFSSNLIIFSLIAIEIMLLVTLGQSSTRFFIDPMLFGVIAAGMVNKERILPNKWVVYVIKCGVIFQVLFAIISISFLLVSFLIYGEKYFHEKYSYGYPLLKIVDEKLPLNESVLLDHRSHGLINRRSISAEEIEYKRKGQAGLDSLELQLVKYNTHIAITYEESKIFALLMKCSKGVISGPISMNKATRNPFNTSSENIYLLDFDAVDLIRCLKSQDKN